MIPRPSLPGLRRRGEAEPGHVGGQEHRRYNVGNRRWGDRFLGFRQPAPDSTGCLRPTRSLSQACGGNGSGGVQAAGASSALGSQSRSKRPPAAELQGQGCNKPYVELTRCLSPNLIEGLLGFGLCSTGLPRGPVILNACYSSPGW